MRAIVVVGVLGIAAAARAESPSVYLNEVKIDQGSVKGATMRGVDVTFDERGDVHITARGYKVTAESQAPEPPLGGRHYYLVPSAQRRVGAAQWDVDVYINEVFVHRFRSKIPEPFVEVTRFIKPGANAVQFTWRKDDGARVSTSRDDVFELKIGTGEFLAGVLQLNAITAVKHNAFETGTFKTDVSIEVPAK